MDHNDVLHFLRLRTFVYDLFRNTFGQEPSPSYVDTISKEGFILKFPFTDESELIQKGVKQIDDYFKQHDVTSGEVYDQLHWDYTRLFIGPYKLLAPPWESLYLSEERLLFQESALQVRSAYAKYGFRPSHYQREPDDHLGLELDFMYQLAHQDEENFNDEKEQFIEVLLDSRSFLETHLLNWVPLIAKDIVQHAHTDFYRGMATILTGYIKIDFDALNELVNTEEAINNDGGEFP